MSRCSLFVFVAFFSLYPMPMNAALVDLNECGGLLVQKAYQTSLLGVNRFMTRIALAQHEQLYTNLAKKAAYAEARRAYRTVPAYRAFADANGGIEGAKSLEQFPVTSKGNYIKPNSRDASLYVNGEIPAGSIRDTSTGTSGIPTPWYRGPLEALNARRILSFRSEIVLGKVPYACINGFALGPWATGITVAFGVGADPKSVLSNIGPSPVELLKTIREMANLFPERTLVVGGYPPHMQELVDLAAAEGVDLSSSIAVVGGEPMSETQRDLIVAKVEGDKVVRTGFHNVYSFYGASDLDINVAFESDFDIALRRAAVRRPDLAKALFGEHPFIPMIFHYDPMANFIEVNSLGNILITSATGDRISPRIRYDLGDRGAVLAMSKVQAILAELGIDLGVKPLTNLPMLFIWGRVDTQITYRAANVSPENLDEALQRAGLGDKIRNHAFRQFEENGNTVTEILLEAANPPDATEAQSWLASIQQELRAINVDFDKQITATTADHYPRLRIFKTDSPMSRHRRDNPSRKRKYIFLGSDIVDISEFEGGGIAIKQ